MAGRAWVRRIQRGSMAPSGTAPKTARGSGNARPASPRSSSSSSVAQRSGSKSARGAPGTQPLGGAARAKPSGIASAQSAPSVLRPQNEPAQPPAQQPRLMINSRSLVIRTGFELLTPKMADLAAGATVQLHETRQLPDGSTRARITLSGTTQGWCTSIGKDGSPSLHEVGTPEALAASEAANRQRRASSGRLSPDRRLSARGEDGGSGGASPVAGGRSPGTARPPSGSAGAGAAANGGTTGAGGSTHGASSGGGATQRVMPVYVISAPKPLLARGEFDLQSNRIGELNPGTKVHVLETRPLPDGSKRVRRSPSSRTATK